MSEWFTASDIAARALPGLPLTKKGVLLRADADGWKRRPRQGRGGGFEYHISALPLEARDTLKGQLARQLVAEDAALVPVADIKAVAKVASHLDRDQRETLEARAAFVAEVNRLALVIGRSKAVDQVVAMVKDGTLPERLQALLPAANAKSGARTKGTAKLTLSRRTLYNWLTPADRDGVVALAPRKTRTPDDSMPAWAPYLVQLWSDPRKPSLIACMERLGEVLPAEIAVPSYDAAKRFLTNKLNIIDRNRGRMGPQQLKSLQAFVRRDTSELWPGAVYSSDGHTFKAKVEHPFHGAPFRPEITAVIDVFTRYVVGWSIGLAENSMGVLEALSDAMIERGDGRKRGLPTIWYTDNGKGFRANMFEEEATGFYDRWGITPKNSLPYNSQARGIIERLNRTLWVPAAKQLLSYQGSDMDKEAFRQIARGRRLALQEGRSARFDLTWDEFKAFIQDVIDAYNARPHSELPRYRDPQTLAYRHLSPQEAWAAWEAEGGNVITLDIEDAADLVRPYERRKVARCEVQILGGIYFSHELEAHHGQEVAVGYDIHDASRVWVRDLADHRLLAVAELGGNRRAYFGADVLMQAKSKQEQVLEARTKGRLKRVEDKRAEIIAEAKGAPLLVEHQEVVTLDLVATEKADRMLAEIEAAPVPIARSADGGRPIFNDDVEWADWLARHPEAATATDMQQLKSKISQGTFRALLEMEGIDLAPLLGRAA